MTDPPRRPPVPDAGTSADLPSSKPPLPASPPYRPTRSVTVDEGAGVQFGAGCLIVVFVVLGLIFLGVVFNYIDDNPAVSALGGLGVLLCLIASALVGLLSYILEELKLLTQERRNELRAERFEQERRREEQLRESREEQQQRAAEMQREWQIRANHMGEIWRGRRRRWGAQVVRFWRGVVSVPGRLNDGLRELVGPENTILFHFVRIGLFVLFCAALVLLAYLLRELVGPENTILFHSLGVGLIALLSAALVLLAYLLVYD